MGENRCRAVEEGELPALVAEEAERRIHAVDAGNEPRGHVVAEIDIGLAQRQQIEQQLEPGPGVSGEMRPVRQKLPLQLQIQIARRLAISRSVAA